MPNDKVITIPKDGTTLTVDDEVKIDLVTGQVVKAGTVLDDFVPLKNRGVGVYVNTNGALSLQFDDGNIFRIGAAAGNYELRKYPGGFRMIKIKPVYAIAEPVIPRNVSIVISTDPDFNLSGQAQG